MKIKQGRDKRIFNIISYLLVTVFAIFCLIPFYLIVVGSFTSEKSIVTEGFSFYLSAKNFSVAAYNMALKNPVMIVRAYGITIFVTVLGTFLAVFLSTMTGYVLARKDFPWGNHISFFFFFTTLFSGGLVPWYLMFNTVF
jgi:putative aldouronate transport system permease protein